MRPLSRIAQLFKNAKKPARPAAKLPRFNVEALEDRVVPAQYALDVNANTLVISLDDNETLTVAQAAGNATFTLTGGTPGVFTSVGNDDVGNNVATIVVPDDDYSVSLTIDDGLADPGSTNSVTFTAGTLTSAAIGVSFTATGADTIAFNGGALMSSGTVNLTATTGSITTNNITTDVTAPALNASAGNGVTVDTSVGTLTASGGTGAVSVDNVDAGTLTIAAGGASGNGVAITNTDATAGTGSLIVNGAVSSTGGAINLITTDTVENVVLDVNAPVGVTGVGGIILSSGNDVSIDAAVSTGTGNISVVSASEGGVGEFTSAGLVGTLTTQGGNITIGATPVGSPVNVNIGGDITVNGGSGLINVQAANDIQIDAAVRVLQSMGVGGSGNLTILADDDNGGNSSGSVVTTTNGILAAQSGDVVVTGDGVTLAAAVSTSMMDGNVTITSLQANDLLIAATGSVSTAGTTDGDISLLADENVSIAGPVSAGGTGDLTVTGNTDGAASGSVTTTGAGTLATSTGDVIISGAGVSIGAGVTAAMLDADISITSTGMANDVSITAAVTATGITGVITVTSADDVSVTAAVSAAGTGTITVDADNDNSGAGFFSSGMAGDISTAGGDITIVAQEIDNLGDINATNTGSIVSLNTRTPADVISLGTESGTQTDFFLSDTELGLVTAGILRVGEGAADNTGGIMITGSVTLLAANVPVLTLTTTGAITDNTAADQPDLTVGSLLLLAGTGIGSTDDIDVSGTNLALSNTTTGNAIVSNSVTGTLNITTVDGIAGATNAAANGALAINSVGDINVLQATTATGGGDVQLTATGPGADVTVSNVGRVAASGGNGNVLVSAGGAITVNDTVALSEVQAAGTGTVMLNAGGGVTLSPTAMGGDGVTVEALTGAVTVQANVGNPTATADILLDTGSSILTNGNVSLLADQNGVDTAGGGMVTMNTGTTIDGSTLLTAGVVTITGGEDVLLTSIDATSVSVTTAAAVLDDSLDGTVVSATGAISLTSGGRIGGNIALTPADVLSASTATPTANFLAALDVNYGTTLTLDQVNTLGNIQIRKVGAPLTTSGVLLATPLVGDGNQIALISDGGPLTIDNAFTVANGNLLLATADGSNVVFAAGGSVTNNASGATTSLLATGGAGASIVGPAMNDGTADVASANVVLGTSGGTIGSMALPLEIDARTGNLSGFTNGAVNNVPQAGGDAFILDTLNGLAVGQFNAGTAGDVTLMSMGNNGAASNITAVTPNDNVAEVIGDVVNLDTSAAAPIAGPNGQIGGPALFFEVDANTLVAVTNQSNLWISAVGTGATAIDTVSVGMGAPSTTTAFLRARTGTTFTNDGDNAADVLAPVVNLSTVAADSGNFGTAPNVPIQIDAAVLVGNLAGGGNAFVQDTMGAGLIVRRLTTTAGDLGVSTTGAGNDLNLGDGLTTGAAVETAAGTATLSSQAAVNGNATAGPLDVIAATLSVSSSTGVGASVNPLLTDVNDLSSATGGIGGVFVSNTGPLTITGTGVTAGGNTAISTSGTLLVNAPVGGSSTSLSATAGDLTTTAQVGGGTDVSLTASGAILTGALVSGNTGSATLTAGTTLTTNSGVSGATDASLTAGTSLTTNAAVTANGGTATLLAAGPVNVNANVSGTAGATITATDAATAGQDVIIATGATVSAGMDSNVSVTAGDTLTVSGSITATGTGVVSLTVDPSAADGGGTVNIPTAAAVTSATVTQVTGGSEADTFNIAPQTGSALNVVGGDPSMSPGDTLLLDTTGATGMTFMSTGTGAGTFTFTNRSTITFTGIENAATATVTIAATDADAAEVPAGATANPGQFTLTRMGDTSGELTVNLMVTGSASNGADYTAIPATVTFAAGQDMATIDVSVAADALTEGTESVTVTIAPASGTGLGYVVGGTSTATVNITDNPPPPPAPAPVPPVYTGAAIINGVLVLAGPNGSTAATFPVPFGSSVLFTDISGDGQGDVILFLPGIGVVAISGQNGVVLAFGSDLNGDRAPDLLIFNPITGAPRSFTDGRTGVTIPLGN